MREFINTIKKLGGATIKNGQLKNYKTGYQVAIESEEKQFTTLNKAIKYIERNGLKNVGLWLDDGIWYMDTNSVRVSLKNKALQQAKENQQLAIWDWKNKRTVYA